MHAFVEMPSSLSEIAGKVDLPFMIELSKNVILAGLQDQVETPIDPNSLAYDTKDFLWEDGQIAMALTFRDGQGFGEGRVYIQPSINDALDVCFLVDTEFIGYMQNTEGLN
jgi:hypothetical protein